MYSLPKSHSPRINQGLKLLLQYCAVRIVAGMLASIFEWLNMKGSLHNPFRQPGSPFSGVKYDSKSYEQV